MKKLISLVLVVVMFVSSTNMANVFKVMADDIVITEEDEAIEYVCNPDDYTYSVENEEVTITKYNGSDEAVKIPDTFEGYPVTKIGKEAFAGNTALVNIQLPETLVMISQGAFYKCTSLEEVTLPDSVSEFKYSSSYYEGSYSYGTGIFASCTALEQVTLSKSMTQIPPNMFRGCKCLKSIEIPEPIEEIGQDAFYDCSALCSVDFPETLNRVNLRAFAGCSALQEVHIPNLDMWYNISFDVEGYNSWFCQSIYRSGANPLYTGAKLYADGKIVTEIDVPESVTTINGYLFAEYPHLTRVRIPDTVTDIKWGAFYNCTGLVDVEIPDSVKIADQDSLKYYYQGPMTHRMHTSFEKCNNAIFYCNRNSATAKYALETNIPVIDKSSSQDSENSMLIYGESNYRFNMDGITASGYLPMVIDYAFKPDADVSDMQITVNIPTDSVLIEESVSVDNFGITNYEYTEGKNTLVIPVEQTKGTIRFSVQPNERKRIVSSAIMKYKSGNSTVSEILGIVYKEMPEITLSSDTTTGTADVAVSGITFAQNTVDIYLDGVYQDSVQANKAGNYSTSLTLPELVDLREYVIRVETTNEDGDVVFEENTIKYVENTPVITSFVMEHSGQTIDLTIDDGINPIVIVDEGRPFKFTIDMENDDNIQAVSVISTRNRIRKNIFAYWDAEKEVYIAEGLFDENDRSYIPGALSITTVSAEKSIIPQESENYYKEVGDLFIQGLDKNGITFDVIVNENTSECCDIELIFKETANIAETQVQTYSLAADEVQEDIIQSSTMNVILKEISKEEYKKNKDSYIFIGNNGDKPLYMEVNQDDTSSESWSEEHPFVKDLGITFATLTASTSGEAGAAKTMEVTFKSSASIAKVVGQCVGGALSIVSLGWGMWDLYGNTDELRQEVYSSPNITKTEAEKIDKKITYINAAQVAIIGLAAAGGAALLTTISWPAFVGALAFAGVASIASTGLGVWQNNIVETKTNQQKSTTMQARELRYGIDPSGYIYDNTTDERIPGATITCYCVEYDGSETFWDNKPAETEYGVMWDASEWSQMNPLTTDLEGRYAWDVPEGWWRVKVEKEGYETVWSEWLPVPPPQTEVNLGMTPLTAALGDINQDGSVDENDVEILNRYFAGWPGYEHMIPGLTVADMNGDKKLTRADAMILARQVARW